MRRYLAFLLCTAALSCAAEPGAVATPLSVGALIKEKGAQAAIDSLWDTPQWTTLIAGISKGDLAWLKVAEEIWPGSDGASASELRDAMAWALPQAPAQVLVIANRNAIWKDTCDGPPVDFPPQGPAAYFKEALAAVGRVAEPSLRATRDECLRKLKAASAKAAANDA
jgi:hypothetical protein